MLSICGSIYLNENLLVFVRSVLENATDPGGIEFVIVEDEAGSDLMASCFEKVRSMTKNLIVIPIHKNERVDYFERCISFYERESIFPSDRISEFRDRLSCYASARIPRLWFPPARNYNLAISVASGDVIMHTPVDLLAHFDVSAVYLKFKEAMKSREHVAVHFGLRGHNEVMHHGSRMFDRALFDALKTSDHKYALTAFSFDERWFIRAKADDDWNAKARPIAGAIGWETLYGERALFSMPKSPWLPEYLCNDMGRDYAFFLQCIKEYQSR